VRELALSKADQANIDEKERTKILDFIENQTSSLKIIEKMAKEAFFLEVIKFEKSEKDVSSSLLVINPSCNIYERMLLWDGDA